MPDFSHPAITIEDIETDLPAGWRIAPMSFVPSLDGRGWSAWSVSPNCENCALLISGALREEHPVAEENREDARRLFRSRSEIEGDAALTPFERRERFSELTSRLRDIMPDERPGVDPDDPPLVSPDGRRVSYVVQTSDDVTALYFDGEPITTWGSVHDMGYSADSKRFFAIFRNRFKPPAEFGANDDDEEDSSPTSEEFLLVDESRFPGMTSFFMFSDDSQHFVAGIYLRKRRLIDLDEVEPSEQQPKSLCCILHDGKEVAHFSSIGYLRTPSPTLKRHLTSSLQSAVLSPDGEIVIFPATGAGYADGKFARPKESFIGIAGSNIEPIQIPNYDLLSVSFPTPTTLEAFITKPCEHGFGHDNICLLRVDLSALKK